MQTRVRRYRTCPFFALVGGALLATLAYNVMGRAVGFENVPLMALLPGFLVGFVSALIISFLVIKNRNLLLERLRSEQDISASLRLEVERRRRIESELLVAKGDAELANRSKSEFLANMSHELRTPLNAVIGFSELMEGETFGPMGDPHYRDYARLINESGHHLLETISDILDVSKIEAGQVELNESPVDVGELFEACLRLVRERADAKGLVLSSDLPPGIELLYADQRMVKQILVNLLSNGIKFTPEGGAVSLRGWVEGGQGHLFRVDDTGIGIASEDIPRVMKPFGQADGTFARKYGGTGLGLPLSKFLTEMHNGYLELQSVVGQGTSVRVQFPSERLISGDPAKAA